MAVYSLLDFLASFGIIILLIYYSPPIGTPIDYIELAPVWSSTVISIVQSHYVTLPKGEDMSM